MTEPDSAQDETTTDETHEETTRDDGGTPGTIPTTPGPERVKLDWRVPAPVWRRFREYHGERLAADVGLGEAVTRALREYLDRDDAGAPLDDVVAELLDAVGLGHEDGAGEGTDTLAEMETTRVHVHAPVPVKEAVRARVRSDPDLSSYGVAVGHALRAAMDGGRTGRATRRIERAVDALEDFDPDQDAEGAAGGDDDADEDQDDAEDEENPLARFSKTAPRAEKEAALAEHLGMTDEERTPVHVDVDFQAAVDVLADGETANDRTVSSYRKAVLPRHNYVEHPTYPFYVPEEMLHAERDAGAGGGRR